MVGVDGKVVDFATVVDLSERDKCFAKKENWELG